MQQYQNIDINRLNEFKKIDYKNLKSLECLFIQAQEYTDATKIAIQINTIKRVKPYDSIENLLSEHSYFEETFYKLVEEKYYIRFNYLINKSQKGDKKTNLNNLLNNIKLFII